MVLCIQLHMKIYSLPLHLRPREKLKRLGASQLKDYELLALLLRSGTAKKSVLDVSKQMLYKNSITDLVRLPLDQLCEIKGLGESKASTMLAAFEIGRRIYGKNEELISLSEPADVAEQLGSIKNATKEHFVIFLLNARNQLIKKETVSIGTLSASLVHPREVFEPAIKHNSATIIISHNHPSGDPTPSDADISITSQLLKAGEIMGIEILDHVIVAPHKYISMKREGYIK